MASYRMGYIAARVEWHKRIQSPVLPSSEVLELEPCSFLILPAARTRTQGRAEGSDPDPDVRCTLQMAMLALRDN